ncbi:MAG: hypothetical protein P4L40_23065 [Terracidiphilus sp.]|nr:hypothetical protein [Terracidiphilus sp.]
MHKRDFFGHNASYWAAEFGHVTLPTLAGLPPPAAPIVEETVTAFQWGQAASLKAGGTSMTGGKAAKKKGKGKKKK